MSYTTGNPFQDYVMRRCLLGGLRGKELDAAKLRWFYDNLNPEDMTRMMDGFKKIPFKVRTNPKHASEWLKGKHASHFESHANGGADSWDNMMWQDSKTNRSYSSENMSETMKYNTNRKNHLDADKVANGDGPTDGGKPYGDDPRARVRAERRAEFEFKVTQALKGIHTEASITAIVTAALEIFDTAITNYDALRKKEITASRYIKIIITNGLKAAAEGYIKQFVIALIKRVIKTAVPHPMVTAIIDSYPVSVATNVAVTKVFEIFVRIFNEYRNEYQSKETTILLTEGEIETIKEDCTNLSTLAVYTPLYGTYGTYIKPKPWWSFGF